MNTKTFNRQKLINIVTALMTVDDEYFIKTLKNILKEIKNLNSTKNEYNKNINYLFYELGMKNQIKKVKEIFLNFEDLKTYLKDDNDKKLNSKIKDILVCGLRFLPFI